MFYIRLRGHVSDLLDRPRLLHQNWSEGIRPGKKIQSLSTLGDSEKNGKGLIKGYNSSSIIIFADPAKKALISNTKEQP